MKELNRILATIENKQKVAIKLANFSKAEFT